MTKTWNLYKVAIRGNTKEVCISKEMNGTTEEVVQNTCKGPIWQLGNELSMTESTVTSVCTFQQYIVYTINI